MAFASLISYQHVHCLNYTPIQELCHPLHTGGLHQTTPFKGDANFSARKCPISNRESSIYYPEIIKV